MSARVTRAIICWLGAAACLLALAGTVGAAPAAVPAAASACRSMPHAAGSDVTTITSPLPNQSVSSPFTIRGTYDHSFEGVVPINILDASGHVLMSVNAMNEGQVVAPYSRRVTFSVSAPTPACIVVYREHPSGAPNTRLAQIPVTLMPPASTLPDTGEAGSNLLLLAGVAVLLGAGGMMIYRRGKRSI
jgi:LPXTG-motif cell wall-anchored protein